MSRLLLYRVKKYGKIYRDKCAVCEEDVYDDVLCNRRNGFTMPAGHIKCVKSYAFDMCVDWRDCTMKDAFRFCYLDTMYFLIGSFIVDDDYLRRLVIKYPNSAIASDMVYYIINRMLNNYSNEYICKTLYSFLYANSDQR